MSRGITAGISRSDAATAALYFVFVTLLHLSGYAEDLLNLNRGVPLMPWLLALAIGCFGVLFRSSRLPVMLLVTGTGIALDLALGLSLTSVFLIYEMLFAATLGGGPRLSRVAEYTGFAGAAGMLVGSLVLSQDWRISLVFALQGLLIFVVPVHWASNVREHRNVAIAERAKAEAERLSAARAAELAELDLQLALTAERSQMARDLHDVIAGHLSAIAIQSEAALNQRGAELSRRVMTAVRENSIAALAEMRSMIDLLNEEARGPGEDTPENSAGDLGAIDSLLASAAAAGLRINSDFVLHHLRDVPRTVSLTAYRIVQEALTNVMKHAPGSDVWLRLTLERSALQIMVRNSVSSAQRNTETEGKGLKNMTIRANRLGGSLAVESDHGIWAIHAELPFDGALV
ncbi:histidine kinase [Saxibacter everestensis]|uniref:histidine kinase n=1 Tax=Saxibacter everestensis TaxID=2909229 RepID=A0ABY8QWY4_9MICO|nr:histidine kinase [Brevibacteriaceae bacterium ZFBP1038]